MPENEQSGFQQMVLQAEMLNAMEIGVTDAALTSAYYNGLLAQNVPEQTAMVLTVWYMRYTLEQRHGGDVEEY